jgi:hypothetical protein
MINATDGEDLPQQTEALQTESISDGHSDSDKESNPGRQDNILNSQPKRTANIYRDTSGEPKGAALWLNTSELVAAGINVDDANAVKIRIEDGDLKLVSTRDKEYE